MNPSNFDKLSTAQVVGVLKKAGLMAAKRTSKERRSGFSVTKVNNKIAAVQYVDWENKGNRAEMFDKALGVLKKKGYTFSHGMGSNRVFGEKALTAIKSHGMAMVLKLSALKEAKDDFKLALMKKMKQSGLVYTANSLADILDVDVAKVKKTLSSLKRDKVVGKSGSGWYSL